MMLLASTSNKDLSASLHRILRPTTTPSNRIIAGFKPEPYLYQAAIGGKQPLKLEYRNVQIADSSKEETSSSAIPVSTTSETSNPILAKTADAEPTKSLFQPLTQRKVLIAAGSVLLLAAGGAAAYFFYPVATAAYATMAYNASSTVVMHTHQFIQPGIANTMLMANLCMKLAVIPAAKVTLSFLSPVISTAIVATLATLALGYVVIKVREATKGVIWSGVTAVANAASNSSLVIAAKELYSCTVIAGKELYKDTCSLLAAPFRMVGLINAEETSEEVGPYLQITDSTNVKAYAEAQKKTHNTMMVSIIKAGLIASGFYGFYSVYCWATKSD